MADEVETESPQIPPPPPTMRATPLAKQIASEIDPSIERFAIKVLAQMNSMATDLLARIDHDGLKTESRIESLRGEVGVHHKMIVGYLTTLQASIVEISEKQTKQGAMLRAHAGRIRAIEVRVKRIETKLAKKPKEKRRAGKR